MTSFSRPCWSIGGFLGATLAVAVVAIGCRGAAGPGALQPVPSDRCSVAPVPDHVTGPVVVALTDAVEPAHAPDPRNLSERLLFTQLYETLVDVDCDGTVVPGLAESWRAEAGGRRWRFTLRHEAAFWDGTPVGAHDIASSWNGRTEIGATALLDSVTVVDDTVLEVSVSQALASPALFARPAFAVARRQAGSRWADGTGPFRVSEAGSSRNILLVRRGAAEAEVALRVAPALDARDLLDEGVDVLVTDQPVALAYAATRPEFVSIPLPWTRTHVLLSPGRIRAGRAGMIPVHVQEGLASDAVRAESRRAQPPFWWQTLGRCTDGPQPLASSPSGPVASEMRRVLYDRADATARDLAARLVALAAIEGDAQVLATISAGWSDPGVRLAAVGLPEERFAEALRGGADFAYVLALSRRVFEPCAGFRTLIGSVPWLTWVVARDPPGDLAAAFVPLVDTRLHAVLRRGRVGVTTDWEGNLQLSLP